MSQTTASALGNRTVMFDSINNDYNCVICMQVADELVRCSGMCAGIFCSGCMQRALASSNCCPSCKKRDATALKDVILRNQIMNHQVYCTNINSDLDETTNPTSRKRKSSSSSDEKCTWIGKYGELSTHLRHCEFEMVPCTNDGCEKRIERRALDQHGQVCTHRVALCEHCNLEVKTARMKNHCSRCPKVQVSCRCEYKCARDEMDEHREMACPMIEIQCEVVGCGAKVMRKDYEQHQDDAAKEHIRLLSATMKRLVEIEVEKRVRLLSATIERLQTAALVVEPRPSQIKWRLTGIAAKIQQTVVELKGFISPDFSVLFHGSHQLLILAKIQGNKLGLFLRKDLEFSDDKSRLVVGGTSVTVSKAGVADKERTFSPSFVLGPPHWCRGWPTFLEDMTPYIDNDGINITLDLKMNMIIEPLVL